jgi:NAD(P) transhydrogenase
VFPYGIYTIPEISMIGETEQSLTKKKLPYEVGLARYREIARGQILADDIGMLKLIFHPASRRLLGVHAIGTGATELIHIGQAVMSSGMGIDYFVDTVFNYPTLAECYKVAAMDGVNRLSIRHDDPISADLITRIDETGIPTAVSFGSLAQLAAPAFDASGLPTDPSIESESAVSEVPSLKVA